MSAPSTEAGEVPHWKRRRNSPVRRVIRIALKAGCALAIGYAGLWGWNWYFGDEFGTGPADMPNAIEASAVRFTTMHPDDDTTIRVHADLITRDGEASAGEVAVARRRDANYIRVDNAWRTTTPEEEQTHDALFSAIDSSMVATLDDVFSRAVWQHLTVTDRRSTLVDGPRFVATTPLDVSKIGTEFSDGELERAFPIPRISIADGSKATPVPAQRLTVDVAGAATTLDPAAATRFGLASGAPARLVIVVDEVGVVRSIALDDSDTSSKVFELLDAGIDRPTAEQSTELGDIPPSATINEARDLEAMTRDAIGPRRFDRIVEHTGVTLGWGSAGRYDAKAIWRESNGAVTMHVRVEGFRSVKRNDLLAHELAHIAAFGAGRTSPRSQECLADIIASHWLGFKIEAGAYDYRHCATHGDAQRILAIYG